jgi:cob(I)alamin adenosyltransferase
LQQDLLTAGSDLACPDPSRPDVPRLSEAHWRRLEDMIDGFEGDLPRLTNFVLPGGSPGGAWLHLARTVCRRAERVLAKAMKREGGISPALLAYLNRLSDLLFVMARFETQAAGKAETTWRAQP